MADRSEGTRRFTLRRSHALAVLTVAALCVVPAGDAFAAGKGKTGRPGNRITKVKPAPPKAKPKKASPVPNLEKEAARRGWAWGATIRGQFVTVGRNGTVSAVSLQRGLIDSVTPTSIVVTSADGVSLTWTVARSTAVIVQKARGGRAAEDTPTTDPTTPTTDPTDPTTDPTAPTTDPNLTAALAQGMSVRVWGYGTTAPAARLIISDPSAPKAPPTADPTTPAPTTDTPTPTTDPTDETEPADPADPAGPTDPADPGDPADETVTVED
jgi:hypothetical protein